MLFAIFGGLVSPTCLAVTIYAFLASTFCHLDEGFCCFRNCWPSCTSLCTLSIVTSISLNRRIIVKTSTQPMFCAVHTFAHIYVCQWSEQDGFCSSPKGLIKGSRHAFLYMSWRPTQFHRRGKLKVCQRRVQTAHRLSTLQNPSPAQARTILCLPSVDGCLWLRSPRPPSSSYLPSVTILSFFLLSANNASWTMLPLPFMGFSQGNYHERVRSLTYSWLPWC